MAVETEQVDRQIFAVCQRTRLLERFPVRAEYGVFHGLISTRQHGETGEVAGAGPAGPQAA